MSGTTKRWVAGGIVAVAVLGGGAVAGAVTGARSAAPAPTTTAAACPRMDDGPWPGIVEGKPADFDAGDRGGVTMWHDGDGWHVRVTHRGDAERTYSGTITTNGLLADHKVLDERGDRASVSPDHQHLTFRFRNFGHVDGVDFKAGCASTLRVDLFGDGHQLPTTRVELGRHSLPPTSVPFTLERSPG